MKFISFKYIIILFLLVMTACQTGSTLNNNSEDRVKAPEFPDGLEWLNTAQPLKLADLKGKIVLLDFWTYCCINCMHIISDLKRLEKEFPNELVVIGVHSAKFTQEKETDNIRQAILRYEIEHPVVNDSEFIVWRNFAARAWPTVVLIDPEGRIAMSAAGEGVYHKFAGPIGKMAETYAAGGKLDMKPLELSLESSKIERQLLSFPGKVHVDEVGERLFISDQNHNRIVIVHPHTGELIDIIGGGEYALTDGKFEDAAFKHPQGICLVNNTLYIADTESHTIRAADLTKRVVETFVGTGEQSNPRNSGGYGTKVDIASPWDVVHKDGILYIAMAGPHQIWTVRLHDAYATPYAGNSWEGLKDGIRTEAWLAQPSGLAILGEKLFFADSEVSAIRYVDISPTVAMVNTIVGKDLFEFGDHDGKTSQALLQHPLGVAVLNEDLYVADTYNSKIKKISLEKREIRTVVGDRKAGDVDGKGKDACLYEPGGIASGFGKIYIADTNNHKIKIYDPSNDEVKTLEIKIPISKVQEEFVDYGKFEVSSNEFEVEFNLQFSKGLKVNTDSPVILEIINKDIVILMENGSEASKASLDANGNLYSVKVKMTNTSSEVKFRLNFVYCSVGNEAVCYPAELLIKGYAEVSSIDSKKMGIVVPVL